MTTLYSVDDFKRIDEILGQKYQDQIRRGCFIKSDFPTRIDFNNLSEVQKFPKELNKYLDTLLKDFRSRDPKSANLSHEILKDPSEKLEKAGDYLINGSLNNFGRTESTGDYRLD